MSIDKDYKVMIHLGEMLIASYTLHTEFEDGEYVDVSSCHMVGEPDNDPLEDEAIDLILESDGPSGKETINDYTVEWHLIN